METGARSDRPGAPGRVGGAKGGEPAGRGALGPTQDPSLPGRRARHPGGSGPAAGGRGRGRGGAEAGSGGAEPGAAGPRGYPPPPPPPPTGSVRRPRRPRDPGSGAPLRAPRGPEGRGAPGAGGAGRPRCPRRRRSGEGGGSGVLGLPGPRRAGAGAARRPPPGPGPAPPRGWPTPAARPARVPAGCHGLAAPAAAAARPGQRGPRGGGGRPRGRAVPGELGAGGRRRRGPVLPPQRHPELHQRGGRGGRGRGGRRGGRPQPAAPRGPGVGRRGRRTEPLTRREAEQPAPGTPVAGFLEEVPEHPGTPAAALRGDQCQRGQGPSFQVRDEPQLYTIAVMGPGPPDHQPAHISRRYSDFERLHRNLQRQFRGPMAAISFPRKRLRRNFTAETIARRSRAFEQFLSHLQAVPELRQAPDLQDFFVLPELRRAQSLTCTGLYREALALWANAWQLQAQLGTLSSPDRPLLTLAGLAVCHQELEDPGEARACCERALQLLGDKSPHPLLAPFLEAHVRLSWRLGLDKRQSEARLQGLQEAGLTPTPPPSLKELLIKEVLD